MAVVVYAIVSAVGSPNGTLVVEAQSSGKNSVSLGVSVSINGQKATTPATLTLSQGTYTVTFSAVPWYTTPPARVVLVPAAKTSYVVGTYNPIEDLRPPNSSYRIRNCFHRNLFHDRIATTFRELTTTS